jgi:AcrR family transcriptional regulator
MPATIPQPKLPHAPRGEDTRGRLLQAAGAVFARHGFANATVREIVSMAGTNIASVNYHFRDKEGLYVAAFRDAFERSLHRVPPPLGREGPADARLRAFVLAMLRRMAHEDGDDVLGRLLAREMAEPSGLLAREIEGMVRPQFEALCAILRELAGRGVGRARIRRCAFSVVGQVMHYRWGRHVLLILEPGLRFDEAGLEATADHIAGFTLAAMRGLRAQAGKRKDVP